MKVPNVLAGTVIILVVVLVPVALFPETIVGMVNDARVRYVERTRFIADLTRRIDAADNGDLDQQFFIALYHFDSREWWRQERYEEVLGPKDPGKGQAMMRNLADAGHPEALYRLSGGFGKERDTWLEALRAGSYHAVRELHTRFVRQPCDDSLNAYVDVVRPRLADPAYPWRNPDLTGMALEWRENWEATLAKDIAILDSIRAETCAAR